MSPSVHAPLARLHLLPPPPVWPDERDEIDECAKGAPSDNSPDAPQDDQDEDPAFPRHERPHQRLPQHTEMSTETLRGEGR